MSIFCPVLHHHDRALSGEDHSHQRHGGALGGKEGGAGAPDAGRRARDDHDLAFELHAYLRVAVERAYAAIQPPSTIRFTPVR